MKKLNKYIALFVEGDTEEQFYKLVKYILLSYLPDGSNIKIGIYNMHGIGSFSDRSIRILKNSIIPVCNCDYIYVYCCYDTDVFEYSPHPPINWNSLKKKIEALPKVRKMEQIKARLCIEDWIVEDIDGIARFLHERQIVRKNGEKGIDFLKRVFQQHGKAYIKGSASKGFIESLSIELIMYRRCEELSKLCRQIGVHCRDKSACKEFIAL